MALYKYGEVEAIEYDLDQFCPKLTDEQFTKRREILMNHIFPKYDILENLRKIVDGE